MWPWPRENKIQWHESCWRASCTSLLFKSSNVLSIGSCKEVWGLPHHTLSSPAITIGDRIESLRLPPLPVIWFLFLSNTTPSSSYKRFFHRKEGHAANEEDGRMWEEMASLVAGEKRSRKARATPPPPTWSALLHSAHATTIDSIDYQVMLSNL